MKNKQVKEHLAHFNIAGFSYYDGAEAFHELKMGERLDISLDPENRYDPHAVAVTYKDYKLGYIPKADNEIFFKLLTVGIKNIVVRVQRLDATEHPEQQVWVIAHLVGE